MAIESASGGEAMPNPKNQVIDADLLTPAEPEIPQTKTDIAILEEARLNPELLVEQVVFNGVEVYGREPGYFSEGDRQIIENYSGTGGGGKEYHDKHNCPHCSEYFGLK